MTAKLEKDKAKQLQDKCQTVLNSLLRDEDNKYCVDCDSKGPRWASWNLGVFLCIRCAGIHRNLGVHISKVKSVNLDSWTPEQVVSLQQMGNSRARAVYEANLPDNFRRPQNDSSLESFIRAKYEHKKYIAREWVPLPLPKVNWEKEIEEEMERQKRKKKTVVEKKIVNNVQVPQLPKPKNPSPKAGRSQTPNSTTENKQGDLLNIQNGGGGGGGGGEDSFSGFLSAPAVEEKKSETKDPIQSEEESFFNQTAPPEKEKVKLTKDSILALYGNTPTNTANFNPAYQNPLNPGGFPQNFAVQANFPTYNNVAPPQPYPTLPQQQQQQQQFLGNQPQWGPYVQPNQYGGFQAQFGAAGTAQVQYAQPTTAQNVVGGFVAPNPFGGIPANATIQQQFASLNLGNATSAAAANATPTVAAATNLWQ